MKTFGSFEAFANAVEAARFAAMVENKKQSEMTAMYKTLEAEKAAQMQKAFEEHEKAEAKAAATLALMQKRAVKAADRKVIKDAKRAAKNAAPLF